MVFGHVKFCDYFFVFNIFLFIGNTLMEFAIELNEFVWDKIFDPSEVKESCVVFNESL